MTKENDGVVEEHVQKHTITEYLHMPEHGDREETLEFRNAKKELEKIEHLGCFKCGTMENRQSHHIFERCWAQKMDFKYVAFFLFNHFDFHGHCRRDFKDYMEMANWFKDHFEGHLEVVPFQTKQGTTGYKEVLILNKADEALDTLYNQLILCRVHHVGEGLGIHYESAPTFFASLVMIAGFDNALTEEEYNKMKQELEDDLRKSGHP